MHPLLLALQIAMLQPFATDISTSHTPNHYISTVGYVDASVIVLPNTKLQWPTAATKLTRGFSSDHTGMDIDARTGDAVYAAFDGTVTAVTHSGPYGNKIVISHSAHPEHISTLYAHLTDTSVVPGDTVLAGQTIGTVGSSGNADGDHLHLEVRINDVAVDPVEYF